MKRKWMICPECEGEGKIVHPACSVLTGEDIAEDPESFEEMMRGTYDVTCNTCHGAGKIVEPTEEEMDAERERAEMARTQAAENGDYEAVNSPAIRRHYYGA